MINIYRLAARGLRPLVIAIGVLTLSVFGRHQILAKPKASLTASKSRKVLQHAKASGKTTSPLLGAPSKATVNGAVKNGFLEVKVLQPRPGRLLYTFTQGPKDDKSFLRMHQINVEASGIQPQKKSQIVTTYPVLRSGVGEVFSPEWSPDGRYILFRLSEPKEDNAYQLYVLDLQTNIVKKVSNRQLTYDEVSWSPDGNYIVYVEGGDWQGDTKIYTAEATYYTGPLKLYVCEWRTGKEQLVAANDTVGGPFSWLAPHTLVYGALSEQKQKALAEQRRREEDVGQQKQLQKQKIVPPRPDVYEYSIEDQKSRLLIQDGYLPFPSPDGQWIAFYGSEDPTKPFPLQVGWQQEAQSAALCVVKRDGSQRAALNRETGFYPMIRWLSDNKHLLTLQPTQDSPKAEAEIKQWDVQKRTFRQVATLYAKDYTEIPLTFLSPKFRPLSVSRDGSQFYVSKSERVGRVPGLSLSVLLNSLQAVDLRTGTVTTIAQLKNAYSIDWREDAVPADTLTDTATTSAPSN